MGQARWGRLFLGLLAGLMGCEGDDEPAAAVDAGPAARTDAGPGPSRDAGDGDAGKTDSGVPDGGPAPGPEVVESQSGERLRRVIVEAAGLERLVGWYDSELEVECSPAMATDGVLRCLPEAADAAVVFADPECSVRVASISEACGSEPRYGIVATPTCPPAHEVFDLGRPLEANARVYTNLFGSCRALDEGAAEGLVELGSEPIAPSTFVAFSLREVDTDGRLRRLAMESEDGARAFHSWLDSERDEPCEPGTTEDSTLRCVPALRGTGPTYFTDETCTTSAALASAPASCPAGYYFEAVGDVCEGAWRISALGDAVAAPSGLHQRTGSEGACLTLPASSAAAFYDAERVDPELFEALNFETAVGVDPLGRVIATDATGKAAEAGLVDMERDTVCAMAPTEDGVFRCLPPARGTPQGVFLDASCTEFRRVVASPCRAPDEFLVEEAVGGSACSARARVWRLDTTSIEARQFYVEGAGGACTPFGIDPSLRYYPVVEEVDVAEFVSGERRIER